MMALLAAVAPVVVPAGGIDFSPLFQFGSGGVIAAAIVYAVRSINAQNAELRGRDAVARERELEQQKALADTLNEGIREARLLVREIAELKAVSAIRSGG